MRIGKTKLVRVPFNGYVTLRIVPGNRGDSTVHEEAARLAFEEIERALDGVKVDDPDRLGITTFQFTTLVALA
jgi:hypothetical protein